MTTVVTLRPVHVQPLPGCALTRLQFSYCKMFLSPNFAATVWPDGLAIVNDLEAVEHNADYHRVAAVCGYYGGARCHRRYARHHEVVHNWLAQCQGGPSLTLRYAAAQNVYSGSQREEHHVNCLQRLWADQLDGVPWRPQELAAAEDALGTGWLSFYPALATLLGCLP